MVFFLLGAVLYARPVRRRASAASALFVAARGVIMTMYGGGFATIPAYLARPVRHEHVGAIHGRLLTAWSVAGILGPVLVNYLREYQIERGVPAAQAYKFTMYLMAGLLVVGFFCNLAVRPVEERFYMTDRSSRAERRRRQITGLHNFSSHEYCSGVGMADYDGGGRPAGQWGLVAVSWALVGIPLFRGVWNTLLKASALFKWPGAARIVSKGYHASLCTA